MAQNRLDYRDALGLIANAETIVSFRRAIYETLRAIRFGGVYFLAPVVADRRVGRVFWNVGFPKSWEQSYRESGRWDDPLPNFALNRGSAFRWSDAENVGNVDDRGLSYLSRQTFPRSGTSPALVGLIGCMPGSENVHIPLNWGTSQSRSPLLGQN